MTNRVRACLGRRTVLARFLAILPKVRLTGRAPGLELVRSGTQDDQTVGLERGRSIWEELIFHDQGNSDTVFRDIDRHPIEVDGNGVMLTTRI